MKYIMVQIQPTKLYFKNLLNKSFICASFRHGSQVYILTYFIGRSGGEFLFLSKSTYMIFPKIKQCDQAGVGLPDMEHIRIVPFIKRCYSEKSAWQFI